MKYNIDKSSLSEERILWLDNLESGLRLFLQKKVDAFPTLSITLACEVKEFGDKFVEIEDNASFDLEGSYSILSAVQSFLAQKISVESSDYTLLIKLTFKKKENTAKEEEKSANDGLPTFIPVNPRYDFD